MDTLVRLNRLALRSFQMATVVLMHVAPDLGRLSYGSAGHLPPLLVAADGSARFLRDGASTPLLALREDVADGVAELAPGDRVVLYADGLVERRREPIDESLERLALRRPSGSAARRGRRCRRSSRRRARRRAQGPACGWRGRRAPPASPRGRGSRRGSSARPRRTSAASRRCGRR